MSEVLEEKAVKDADKSQENKRPFPENKKLRDWVDGIDGLKRVAAILGYDPSNIWRYCVGELETPKIIDAYMKISKENAELKQDHCTTKRINERLKREAKKIQEENRQLRAEMGRKNEA